jgi:shikimate dehydrogenase
MRIAAGFPDDDPDPDLKILDILVDKGVITSEQREQAIVALRSELGDIDQVLVNLGLGTEEYVGMARAKAYNLQWFDLMKHTIEPDAANLIPTDVIRTYGVLPVVRRDDKLFVAVSDPAAAINALDEIRTHLSAQKISPQPVLASKTQLQAAIERHLNGFMSPSSNLTSHLTGATKVVAVWGHPVAHSRSPKMHNAALAALGLDWIYVPFDVAPENLGEAVAGLRAMGFVGANCTVPLKEQVGQYLDVIDPATLAAGSINTIVNRDGRLTGYSTDGPGLIWDLTRNEVEIHKGMEVLIWGAGGSSRAIAMALAASGCVVTIANRTVDRAKNVSDLIGGEAKSVGLSGDEYCDALERASLLINTTTLGMNGVGIPPIPDGTLRGDQAVYDIVYSPSVTPLLSLARKSGVRKALNGLGMLACQGALSLALWTDLTRAEMPVDIMLAAIDG